MARAVNVLLVLTLIAIVLGVIFLALTAWMMTKINGQSELTTVAGIGASFHQLASTPPFSPPAQPSISTI